MHRLFSGLPLLQWFQRASPSHPGLARDISVWRGPIVWSLMPSSSSPPPPLELGGATCRGWGWWGGVGKRGRRGMKLRRRCRVPLPIICKTCLNRQPHSLLPPVSNKATSTVCMCHTRVHRCFFYPLLLPPLALQYDGWPLPPKMVEVSSHHPNEQGTGNFTTSITPKIYYVSFDNSINRVDKSAIIRR